MHIATARRPDLLARTLRSLANCRLPAGYKQTIVIENGPRAGAESVVRSAPACLNARYRYCPRGSKSAALNTALEGGDGLIFFTDDDVRLDPDVVMAYANAAEAAGPAHFFGGPTEVEYELAPPKWLRQYLPRSATGWRRDGSDNRVNAPEFLGFNWAAFAADLQAVGGFHLDRGPGSLSGSTGQEWEMQQRLLKNGITGVYVPEAFVWHYVPVDRCSPKWAIERSFRHGVEAGTRIAANPDRYGLSPWWIARHCFKAIARSLLWSISPYAQRRFQARYRRSFDRGLLRGLRCERRAEKLTPAQPTARAA